VKLHSIENVPRYEIHVEFILIQIQSIYLGWIKPLAAVNWHVRYFYGFRTVYDIYIMSAVSSMGSFALWSCQFVNVQCWMGWWELNQDICQCVSTPEQLECTDAYRLTYTENRPALSNILILTRITLYSTQEAQGNAKEGSTWSKFWWTIIIRYGLLRVVTLIVKPVIASETATQQHFGWSKRIVCYSTLRERRT